MRPVNNKHTPSFDKSLIDKTKTEVSSITSDSVGTQKTISTVDVDSYTLNPPHDSSTSKINLPLPTVQSTSQTRNNILNQRIRISLNSDTLELSHIKEIENVHVKFETILDSFNSKLFSSAPIKNEELQNMIESYAALAGAFSWEISQDAYYIQKLNTHQQDSNSTKTVLSSTQLNDLFEKINTENFNQILPDYLNVVSANKIGILDAVSSLGLSSTKLKALRSSEDFATTVQLIISSEQQLSLGNLSISDSLKHHLHKIGEQLRDVYYANQKQLNRDEFDSILKKNPLAADFMCGIHALWAKRQLQTALTHQTSPNKNALCAFEKLPIEIANRNIAVAVAALSGILQVSELFEKKIKGEHRKKDNVHITTLLESTAKESLDDSPPLRNMKMSNIIGIESALQIISILQLDDKQREFAFIPFKDIAQSISFQSGEYFYAARHQNADGSFPGAKKSSYVAMQKSSELLELKYQILKQKSPRILEGKDIQQQFQAYVFDLCKRASLEDIAQIMPHFIRGICTGNLREQLIENFSNDYFAPYLTGADNTEIFPSRQDILDSHLEELTDTEREDLIIILLACNIGWKGGQIHQAAQNKDLSRIDSDKRAGVFNYYERLIQGSQSDLHAYFAVLKDAIQARKHAFEIFQ
jgi:hypothetical protein